MEAFEISELLTKQGQSQKSYLEFLRVSSLSLGLYVLPEGANDPQEPHTEDEVYYVVSGKGFITVGEEQQTVNAGSVVFVKAADKHHFHDIEEKLVLLVFFAPAEYSQT